MSPKKTFTFHISDEMKAALRRVREADGISEAEQIRRGVQMWLDSRAVREKAASRRASTRRKA
jgi:hypothetical protein